MRRYFAPYEPHLYAVFRIVVGLMFIVHGTQKLFGEPGEQPGVDVSSLAGAAGIIELSCGFLVLIGLFASVAGFIAAGEMAVAYFMVHAPRGLWPLVNQGELAVLYCFAFLYMAARGSGIWSVDALRHKPGQVMEFERGRRAA